MKYIINTSYNYADEFDYPVFSIMSEIERDKLISTYDIWKFEGEKDYYFGTNEKLRFYSDDILDLIKTATPIDDTTFKTTEPFFPKAYLNIADHILDRLYDLQNL